MNGRSPARWIASCFGCGLSGIAPGTVGSGFALVLFVALLADRALSLQVSAILVSVGIGVWSAGVAAREIGRGDPGEVVIDELSGMWIALLGSASWPYWLAAFLLFRVFDIVKPFPANVAERLPGGWGIMADDLVAGAQTLLVLELVRYLV